MAEEATAASRSLAQEGESLAQLIGQFTLRNKGSGDGRLSDALQKAAPHAFQAAQKPRVMAPSVVNERRVASSKARARSVPAVGGKAAAVATVEDDWTEF
jgi:hypothetical protein